MEELQKLKESFSKQEWVMPEWTDKVMSLLQDNEVAEDQNKKKYPRVRGLRRIGSFLSDVFITCEPLAYSTEYSACKATAIRILDDGKSTAVVASSTAEATPGNVNNEAISKHLLATAESRAEGRCWTKVLKLNCLTAEEISLGENQKTVNAEEMVDIDKEAQWFNSIQKNMINKKCKNLNVNILKLAEFLVTRDNLGNKSIDKTNLSKQLASKMIEELDKSIKEERGSIKFDKETELQGYESIY